MILYIAMLLLLMPQVEAKEVYAGDTTLMELDPVHNRHRTYFYPEWWDTVNNYCNDTMVSQISALYLWNYGLDSNVWSVAREMIIDRPLLVKGVAVMVDRLLNRYFDEEWLSEERVAEYVWMANYNSVADSMEPFAISRWDTAKVQIMPLQFACDEAHYATIDFDPRCRSVYDSCYVYEAYFDEPVFVDSTFWMVGTQYNNTTICPECSTFKRRPVLYYGAYQFGKPWRIVGGPKGKIMSLANNRCAGISPMPSWGHSLLIVDYQYYLSAEAFEDYGTISGEDWYVDSTVATLEATPNIGYLFSHWSDGSVENPRSIPMTQDTHLVAYFERDPTMKNVSVISGNWDMGGVMGGGVYRDSTVVDLVGYPYSDRYMFTHWNDGDTNSVKSYKVSSDTTFVAYFAKNPDFVQRFFVKVSSSNTSMGFVSGNGLYDSNSVARIMASPVTGYLFDRWNDGDTTNPRDVLVLDNMDFVAYFKSETPVGIDEVETERVTMLPNPSQSQVNITAESVINNLECYDLSGKLHWQETPKSNRALLNVSQWTPGIYVVKITTERGVTVKKLVVQ